ncbi:hypothetical protein HDE68_000784 [Pedobacter cryoconitis]|uniref:Uncharacterized protein n=1 Tax=Pedobacter cryoconitis TaxID=188932 RepID=A0A7W9DY62_9SPHI|nr:hypothetical protein [Pedobacter cryoconitis]MBB5634899.1 hypothetical protein [Pedobacter cryoconitis]
MQSSIKVNGSLVSGILSGLNNSSDALKERLIQLINVYSDQLAYMLLAYHPREKVSSIQVIADSIHLNIPEVITLKIQYALEEFSVCSAIDTLQLEKMTLTMLIDQKTKELEIKGEYWPERDPD